MCRWGTDWLTTLLIATNEPWAPIAVADRARSAAATFGEVGLDQLVGQVGQSVSWWSRGTSSEWPWKTGRTSRKAIEISSSKTISAGSLAGDDRAEEAVAGRAQATTVSAPGSIAELELGVVADEVAVDLDRERARHALGVGRDRLDPAPR